MITCCQKKRGEQQCIMYPMAPESVDFMNVKNVETAFYPYKL